MRIIFLWRIFQPTSWQSSSREIEWKDLFVSLLFHSRQAYRQIYLRLLMMIYLKMYSHAYVYMYCMHACMHAHLDNSSGVSYTARVQSANCKLVHSRSENQTSSSMASSFYYDTFNRLGSWISVSQIVARSRFLERKKWRRGWILSLIVRYVRAH